MSDRSVLSRERRQYFGRFIADIGMRLQFLEDFFKGTGANILLVAYRGYSYSEGKPSEKGIKMDGHAILQYALTRSDVIDPTNVFLLGRSFGSAVAIYVATTGSYDLKGLILENAFTSIEGMFVYHLPKLSKFRKLVLRNHWDNESLISEIRIPILFVHAIQDKLVPQSMPKLLIEKAINSPAVTELAMNTENHNSTYLTDLPKYLKAVNTFMRTKTATAKILV